MYAPLEVWTKSYGSKEEGEILTGDMCDPSEVTDEQMYHELISEDSPLRCFNISPYVHLSVPFCVFPIYALLTWPETLGTAEVGCKLVARMWLWRADSASYTEGLIHALLIKTLAHPNLAEVSDNEDATAPKRKENRIFQSISFKVSNSFFWVWFSHI